MLPGAAGCPRWARSAAKSAARPARRVDHLHWSAWQLLGVFRHPRLAGGGGGGVKRPHVIIRERMAAEIRATRRSKALDETILKHPPNFTNEVTCQVKVRSNVKIGAFRLRAVETTKLSVLGQNLFRILQKYRVGYWLSKCLILSSVQGQDQVTKGHHT